ncbi:MAG: hypothetical protein U5N55_12640, partial [Cypionkella sp.]|nr:hypothetical protein [Cypionkella sp.]
MPRSSGIYTLPPSYFAVTGTTIEPVQHNAPFEDVSQALTDSVPRDGSAPMTGNFPMGANRITGLAAGVAGSDAARMDQRVFSAWLDSVSALSLGVDEYVYASGANVAATAVATAYGRSLLAGADASAVRVLLSAQAADQDLTDIAALAPAQGSIVARGATAWQGLTPTTAGQVLTFDGTDAVWGVPTSGIN